MNRLVNNMWRCLIAIFAISQLAPAGVAVAAEQGDFTIVICTMDGEKSVSWEEFTGEPSPYGSSEQPSDHSGNPCHACVTGACAGTSFHPAQSFLPNVALLTPALVEPKRALSFQRSFNGPPLPSRAPPVVLI